MDEATIMKEIGRKKCCWHEGCCDLVVGVRLGAGLSAVWAFLLLIMLGSAADYFLFNRVFSTIFLVAWLITCLTALVASWWLKMRWFLCVPYLILTLTYSIMLAVVGITTFKSASSEEDSLENHFQWIISIPMSLVQLWNFLYSSYYVYHMFRYNQKLKASKEQNDVESRKDDSKTKENKSTKTKGANDEASKRHDSTHETQKLDIISSGPPEPEEQLKKKSKQRRRSTAQFIRSNSVAPEKLAPPPRPPPPRRLSRVSQLSEKQATSPSQQQPRRLSQDILPPMPPATSPPQPKQRRLSRVSQPSAQPATSPPQPQPRRLSRVSKPSAPPATSPRRPSTSPARPPPPNKTS